MLWYDWPELIYPHEHSCRLLSSCGTFDTVRKPTTGEADVLTCKIINNRHHQIIHSTPLHPASSIIFGYKVSFQPLGLCKSRHLWYLANVTYFKHLAGFIHDKSPDS